MDPNTHSTHPPSGQLDDDLAALEAAAGRLAARDLDRLPDPVRADRVLALRGLVDRLEGLWLRELAGVDGRGAAGAERDQQVGSTAAWLGGRLRMGEGRPAPPCGPPGPCSGAPWPGPARRCVPGSCRRRMPGCWPRGPESSRSR
jgi:hypothetical protein